MRPCTTIRYKAFGNEGFMGDYDTGEPQLLMFNFSLCQLRCAHASTMHQLTSGSRRISSCYEPATVHCCYQKRQWYSTWLAVNTCACKKSQASEGCARGQLVQPAHLKTLSVSKCKMLAVEAYDSSTTWLTNLHAGNIGRTPSAASDD